MKSKRNTIGLDGLTTKEVSMQATMNAPMIRVPLPRRPAARKSISELLDQTRIEDPVWIAKFDDAHLHVAASVDFNDVIELILTAPCERLAGYVEGLYVNN